MADAAQLSATRRKVNRDKYHLVRRAVLQCPHDNGLEPPLFLPNRCFPFQAQCLSLFLLCVPQKLHYSLGVHCPANCLPIIKDERSWPSCNSNAI